jgi:hypothetical protein
MVACTNAGGGPELVHVTVTLEHGRYALGDHYDIAKLQVEKLGYEKPVWVVDEHEAAFIEPALLEASPERLPGPFHYETPAWANTRPTELAAGEALQRAEDLANAYYPLGSQTGIHSMIEWCGVMGEYVKMLRHVFDHGIDPREVDQHHEDCAVSVPDFMIAYFCEKLGCQLKPFIRADPGLWRSAIEKWFKGVTSEQFVVAAGNPFDGIVLHGPFDDGNVANEWADVKLRGASWECAKLVVPAPLEDE